MKKEIINYICALHGYLVRLKEIHWSTSKNSIHLLCDEIMWSVSDAEDRFAESAMGYFGKKIQVGQLKPDYPVAKDLSALLVELEADTLKIRKSLRNEKESGLVNVLDDVLTFAGKYKYRMTQL